MNPDELYNEYLTLTDDEKTEFYKMLLLHLKKLEIEHDLNANISYEQLNLSEPLNLSESLNYNQKIKEM